MANNATWQRRSDNWVKMLDQSRLRKEKRLADQKSTSEIQIKKKTKGRICQ